MCFREEESVTRAEVSDWRADYVKKGQREPLDPATYYIPTTGTSRYRWPALISQPASPSRGPSRGTGMAGTAKQAFDRHIDACQPRSRCTRRITGAGNEEARLARG